MQANRLASLLVGAAAAVLFSTPVWAAQHTWTGKISDSNCGASHKAAIEHGGKNMTDAECTKACVKAGAKYVLVHEGKVIPITNQDFAGLEENAGQNVRLTGEMTGDSITVSRIAPQEKKKTTS